MSEPDTPKQRRYLAFVENKAEPLDGVPPSRITFVLDCVESVAFQEGRFEDHEALALVRILSTPRRLLDLFELPRLPTEGDWLEIMLSDNPGNQPLAWCLSARNNYQGPAERLYLVGLRFLPSEREPGLAAKDPEAATLPERQMVALQFMVSPPIGDRDERVAFDALFADVAAKSGLHARVLDVGQACAIALCNEKSSAARILGFFDVGWPLWFHSGSLPKAWTKLKLAPDGDGFVILSHWDFDHFAMALWKEPGLRKLRWYAPHQAVGPNTKAFADSLGDRLTYLSQPTYGPPNVQLFRGLGAQNGVPDDRNATGYVLRFEREGHGRLLAGDVDYRHVPPGALANLAGVYIPHHAGSGGTKPPTPAGGGGEAVASYGLPNKYRHPNDAVLNAHYSLGWNVQHTASTKKVPRGDRWL
ncbi:hypothetical protein ACO2Q0_01520 [Phenylobacterium sp. VNQ135]|uniref:hypothetical protein n=1 Tax=Phenylobacterium sp. VNQ135 TaxID=3400922 RepID=UPI003BFE72AE